MDDPAGSSTTREDIDNADLAEFRKIRAAQDATQQFAYSQYLQPQDVTLISETATTADTNINTSMLQPPTDDSLPKKKYYMVTNPNPWLPEQPKPEPIPIQIDVFGYLFAKAQAESRSKNLQKRQKRMERSKGKGKGKADPSIEQSTDNPRTDRTATPHTSSIARKPSRRSTKGKGKVTFADQQPNLEAGVDAMEIDSTSNTVMEARGRPRQSPGDRLIPKNPFSNKDKGKGTATRVARQTIDEYIADVAARDTVLPSIETQADTAEQHMTDPPPAQLDMSQDGLDQMETEIVGFPSWSNAWDGMDEQERQAMLNLWQLEIEREQMSSKYVHEQHEEELKARAAQEDTNMTVEDVPSSAKKRSSDTAFE